jgi:hypothetical protein
MDRQHAVLCAVMYFDLRNTGAGLCLGDSDDDAEGEAQRREVSRARG